jgi:hypothetical protein
MTAVFRGGSAAIDDRRATSERAEGGGAVPIDRQNALVHGGQAGVGIRRGQRQHALAGFRQRGGLRWAELEAGSEGDVVAVRVEGRGHAISEVLRGSEWVLKGGLER